jgi:hypothetical protein
MVVLDALALAETGLARLHWRALARTSDPSLWRRISPNAHYA